MGKAEKRLTAWRENPPVDVPISEVRAVLKRHFPNGYKEKAGSHIIVRHEKLEGFGDFGHRGEFSIPVKGGQKVKGRYLKRLVAAVDILEERRKVEP